MNPFSPLDLAALAWFAGAWVAYAIAIEWSRYGERGLNQLMNHYREPWIRRMLGRDMRMVDMHPALDFIGLERHLLHTCCISTD